MEKTREFALERREEPYRQLFVLTDNLATEQLLLIEKLGKKRGIQIIASNTLFRGVETTYKHPFTRMIMVGISTTATSIDNKLTDKLEGVLNKVLAIVPGRCAVYNSSSQLYYREQVKQHL